MSISVSNLQKYFEIERANTNIDLNKLCCGTYAAYSTQVAFMHYQRGFNLSYRLFGSDGK